MSGLNIDQLTKNFGKTRVIQGVDLDIGEGEFVVFVGPSGCGKSTLLRLIAGLEEPSAGSISIDRKDVTDLPSSQRNLAMVFQSYALYPHMTVAQNIGFGLRMNGVSKSEVQKRTRLVAETLQLDHLLQRKPKQLSGGQRQRVAIGRAIIRDPKVFLFDEPLSNLDAELRVEMRQEIIRLHKSLDNVTMIYVTHDQVEAMTMADKIVVLNKGKIEQVGSPLELYNKPRNQFVAGFIGSPKMNFLKTKLCQPSEHLSELTLGEQTRIKVPINTSSIKKESELIMGCRPEDVSILEDTKGPYQLVVKTLENLGSSTYLHGSFAGTDNFIMEYRGERQFKTGDAVNFDMDIQKIHLFDKNSLRLSGSALLIKSN